MRVGIVGLGHVGKSMLRLFPDAAVYDKHLPRYCKDQGVVNSADFCFVCVPTPTSNSGAADVSIVEEVLSWLTAQLIVIKSTVPPGTTERLRAQYNKRIVCSPEYFGESTYWHPWAQDPRAWPFVIVGGQPEDTRSVVELHATVLGPNTTYRQVTAETAELAKYMENAWLASQVTFSWQFGLLASAIGIDYWEVRELWALDPRVSRWHTAFFNDAPGFGGKCLPKDIAAITHLGRSLDCNVDYLESIRRFNSAIQSQTEL